MKKNNRPKVLTAIAKNDFIDEVHLAEANKPVELNNDDHRNFTLFSN